MTMAAAYAQLVPGTDPVHTVAAIELLELALANYDAGFYRVPAIDSTETLGRRQAWNVARQAVADAEVAHDLQPWVPGTEWPASADPLGVDDHVAALELAIVELRHRVATRGHRRPVRPL